MPLKLDTISYTDKTIERNQVVIELNKKVIAKEDEIVSGCEKLSDPNAIACINRAKEAGRKAMEELCQMNKRGEKIEKIEARAKELMAAMDGINRYCPMDKDVSKSQFNNMSQAINNAKPTFAESFVQGVKEVIKDGIKMGAPY